MRSRSSRARSGRYGNWRAGANAAMKSAKPSPYSESTGETGGSNRRYARAIAWKNASPTSCRHTGNALDSAALKETNTLFRYTLKRWAGSDPFHACKPVGAPDCSASKPLANSDWFSLAIRRRRGLACPAALAHASPGREAGCSRGRRCPIR